MNKQLVKVCALCDHTISHKGVVCKAHIKEYREYKDEQWFIELVETQEKQFAIDKKECVTIHKLSENTLSTYLGKMSRPISIPKDIIIHMHVNLGIRSYKIAKELDLKPDTVRRIINRYKTGQKY